MPNRLLSIVLLGFVTGGICYADHPSYHVGNLNGVYVTGPNDIERLELKGGVAVNCKPGESAGSSVFHKCELENSTAVLTNSRGDVSHFTFDRTVMFIKKEPLELGDLDFQYYLRGSWAKSTGSRLVSSPALLMIFHRKGEASDRFHGFLELTDFSTKGAVSFP